MLRLAKKFSARQHDVPGRWHSIKQVGGRWPWVKGGVGSGSGGGKIWCEEWVGSSH
jgi:hypothetical protein